MMHRRKNKQTSQFFNSNSNFSDASSQKPQKTAHIHAHTDKYIKNFEKVKPIYNEPKI